MDNENPNANNLLDNERVYRISLPFIEVLDERLEKLNKKAKKLGVSPVSYEIVGEEIEEEDDYVKVFKLIRVFGSAPIINGWRFEMKIEHNDGFNILYPSPDSELSPNKWVEADSDCGHCGSRRDRNNTYILSEIETGNVIQVGSSCLKDFLGHASPQAIADWVEFLQGFEWDLESSDSDMDFWGERGVRYYDATSFLCKVACVVRRNGWISRSAGSYNRTPTADTAWMWTTAKAKQLDALIRDGYEVTEEDVELADFALDYCRGLSDDEVISVMIIPSAKDLLVAVDRLGIDSICNYDRTY